MFPVMCEPINFYFQLTGIDDRKEKPITESSKPV